MSIPTSIIRRLVGLKLPARAYDGVLSIIADMQEDKDAKRIKDRERKRKFRGQSTDADGTESGNSTDNPVGQKEIPPTPPKEKTLVSSEANASSETIRRKRNRIEYPSDFDAEFWSPYPRTPVMSKVEALAAWKKLSTEDHRKAISAVPLYAAWLKSKPDHPAVHACRFLSERRFDGFLEAAQTPTNGYASGYYAQPDSEQLEAWDQHHLQTKGKRLPRDRNGGWYVPNEWPDGKTLGEAAQ